MFLTKSIIAKIFIIERVVITNYVQNNLFLKLFLKDECEKIFKRPIDAS